MPMNLIRDFVLLPLLLFSATATFTPQVLEAQTNPPIPLNRYKLANGLRVWHQYRPDSKSVIVYLVIQTGSRNETAFNNGISHYVEHMLFTGTKRWTEEQVKDTITNIGGSWNGWTSKEQTAYYAQVADLDVEIALDWLSQIVFHPTFPVEKVEKERHVVFQEKGGQYGWLINQLEAWGYGYNLSREVEKSLFPNATLTMTVIGEEESLKRIDRQMMLDYYKQYYNTENADLIVVGNVEASKLQPLATKYFGDLRSQGKRSTIVNTDSANQGNNRVKVAGPMLNDQIRLTTGTQTVGYKHRDQWSLDVLAKMMDRDLTQEIRTKRGLVYSLFAFNSSYQDVGYFAVSTRSEEKHRDMILQLVDSYIENVRQGKVDEKRLMEAKTALIRSWSISRESNGAIAGSLVGWSAILADTEPVPDYVAEIEKVSVQDLVRVVQTYFVPQRRFVGIHQPAITLIFGLQIAGVVVVIVGGWIFYRVWRRKHKQSNKIVGADENTQPNL
ncbi:hypothetical protein B9G53_23475 [Pseudanabaena sp. SR411]|uniref:M16 family metallopeptidase n=1 Tax=Pseudanabaena sp. SR411 TaxID=1980935 RepID=UPI000B98B074|nr:pitrilysin family protein [Pseudanabaena sp. SR411]OYQ62200.1 hypothetical protein B9G53_23475 [Pseudanabaena sp. SR411]